MGLAEAGLDVRQYKAFVHTTNNSTGEVAETPITIVQAHTWDRTAGQSILELRAAYIVQAGAVTNPRADYQVLWNGTAIPACVWQLQGGTISGGRFNPAISLFCELPAFVQPGNYTVQVTRSNVVGEPVTSSTTSIILHQRETVTMDLDVTLHPFQALLPVFWLAVFWWSTWRASQIGTRYAGAIMFAAVGFIASVLPPNDVVDGLRLTALWGLFGSILLVTAVDRFGARATSKT